MHRMRFLRVEAGKEEKSRELLNQLQINTKHRNSFSYYRWVGGCGWWVKEEVSPTPTLFYD
jgi:hypothetical protein